jgi:CheY-like chemotaxis protein
MKNILLIDDDADDCMFLSYALVTVSNSVNMYSIQDTDLFTEAIDKTKPSIIFIDYHMPKRSGLDLLKQIKSHPAYGHIPVVIWGTFCMRTQIAEVYCHGAQLFVQKPYSLKAIASELKTILQLCH